MSVMKRLSGIVQAKTNKLLDKAEDPRESLDLSYQKQLESLQKVRRSVADVTTAKKRIELQASGLQTQADKLQQQAKAALTQGNEDLAREALGRRTALAEQLTDLQTQHEQVSTQEQKLIATAQKLQSQVDSFRTKKETMKASYTAAEAQTKIGEAVSGISESMSDAGMSMQRAQDKIDGMQARAGAMDELLASGALTDLTNPVDDIQAQLNQASTTSEVDAQLAALKAEVGAGSPPAPELGAAAAAPAPAAESAPVVERGETGVVIVRILGEGQYSVPEKERGTLEKLDAALAEAVDSNDEPTFNRGLSALTAEVRKLGEPVADDAFAPSDLVVPFPDATLEETKELLAQSEDGARADNPRD